MDYLFGQYVTKLNPPSSPSGPPLLSGPPTYIDIHQIFIPFAVWVATVFLDQTSSPRHAARRSLILVAAAPTRITVLMACGVCVRSEDAV